MEDEIPAAFAALYDMPQRGSLHPLERLPCSEESPHTEAGAEDQAGQDEPQDEALQRADSALDPGSLSHSFIIQGQSAYSSLFSLSLSITLDVASASGISAEDPSLKSRLSFVPACRTF